MRILMIIAPILSIIVDYSGPKKKQLSFKGKVDKYEIMYSYRTTKKNEDLCDETTQKKKQLNIEDILFTCDLVSRNNLDPLIVLNNRNISHLINYITQDD
ncbi:hypothetical protein QR98_0028400 [Sarcoptes scabiei]|uniref:Uncharacterized protein n=1 Tax=Sarcoptes scabiei TaxID=52283 RepID=A0A132A012_SARSC|nr:hypothetical protein QR98_0028400 [Sarcoptes scabiei]